MVVIIFNEQNNNSEGNMDRRDWRFEGASSATHMEHSELMQGHDNNRGPDPFNREIEQKVIERT